jgi:diguanylate cyclase (GGDEF)-like protein
MKITYFDNDISILESIKMNSRKLDILNNQEVFILKGYLTKDKILNILMLDTHLISDDLIDKIKDIYDIKLINYPEQTTVKTSFSDRYVEYTSNTATIFDLPDLYKNYFKNLFIYDIKNLEINNKRIMNEAEQFSFLIIDKYIDHLTSLPMSGLLYKIIGERLEDKTSLYEDKLIKIKFKRVENGNEIIFMDLNNLKSMNDIYGHNIADTMLVEFSKALIEEFPDFLHFRIGGDEFVSITPNKSSSDILISRVNSIDFNLKIKSIINSLYDIDIDENLLIIASGGSETYYENEDFKKILSRAEEKMYINKKILHLTYGKYDRDNKVMINKLKSLEPLHKILSSDFYLNSSLKEKLNILTNNKHIKQALSS